MSDGVDFAVVAWREEGRWEAASLPTRVADGLEGFVAALRQQPAEGGTLGLVSVGDDFFLAVRLTGVEVRYLLSDVTAAEEWPLAAEVLDALDLPMPDEDDEAEPVGDLDILADLGIPAMEVAAMCGDLELYPDELLAQIASRLGFGDQFDRAVELAR